MIGIIDYGLGNIGSILNMLKYLNIEAQIIQDEQGFDSSDKLILPGVGSFDEGMKNLKELNLIDLIKTQVEVKGKKILGICLGMQLMLDGSEEGTRDGLGLISGTSKKFISTSDNKVPHMGWNEVNSEQGDSIAATDDRFYFVHSYYVVLNKKEDTLFTTEYGIDFCSGFQHDNILGVQFHPEKSHKYGKKLLSNFAAL